MLPAKLNKFLFPNIEEDDTNDIKFQLDVAPCHKVKVTIDLLLTVLGNRIVSRLEVVI